MLLKGASDGRTIARHLHDPSDAALELARPDLAAAVVA
jgi:hypothetical protein